MKVECFEDLIIWQKSKELTIEIFRIFEESKLYNFKNQIERACISIMNNVAEGFERRSNKDFKQFLYFAKGSSGEVRNMLHLGKDLNIIEEKKYISLLNQSLEISKMIAGLIRKI